MTSPKKHKLDIFQVLGQISSKNADFYRNLTEEEQKAFQPLVVMRWLSGTRSAQQIYFLNELVNPFVFNMAKHKELLVDLMTICSPGRSQRYFWNKANGKRTSSMPKTVEIVREFLNYSSSEVIEVLPLLDNETIIAYAEELGKQPDEIKLINKELKSRA